MKQFISLLFVLFVIGAKAQIVNIPDANFKQALVTYSDLFGRTIDTNNDGEIQYSEALFFSQINGGYSLTINNKNITDLTGIKAFSSLNYLNCGYNQLNSLDISNMPIESLSCINNNLSFVNLAGCGNLRFASIDHNQLNSINLTGLNSLTQLGVSYNNFTSLDVSNAHGLKTLYCEHNQLTSLDLSQNSIRYLYCANNQLTSLNVKNNQAFEYTTSFPPLYASGNPALQYVCADTAEILFLLNYFVQNGMNNVQVDANCSFSTSGGYGTVNGVAKVDLDNNGCNLADNGKVMLPLKLINDNDTSQNFFLKADSSGEYSVHTYAGNYSLTTLNQIPYYNISPDTIHFTTTAGTTQNLNFCITPDGVHNDLDVIFNYIVAFVNDTTRMRIIFRNKGTQALSGNLQLGYDDNKLDFVSAAIPVSSQSTGNLTWEFTNLQPFETRVIEYVYMKILSAPINNMGDTLSFVASIDFPGIDETPADNIYLYKAVISPNVLPITMEYLKGTSRSGKHYLNWKATCTSSHAEFVIESSSDGRTFTAIGNTSGDYLRCRQPFYFTDNNPLNGVNFYRIKMIDIDGKTSNSTTIALLNKKSGFEIVNLTPNPVTNENALLNITSAEKQTVNILVTDASGKIVHSTYQPVIAGFTQVKLNFNNLATGVYTIAVYTNEGERKTVQFIKK